MLLQQRKINVDIKNNETVTNNDYRILNTRLKNKY